jgi:hypothetical protein
MSIDKGLEILIFKREIGRKSSSYKIIITTGTSSGSTEGLVGHVAA